MVDVLRKRPVGSLFARGSDPRDAVCRHLAHRKSIALYRRTGDWLRLGSSGLRDLHLPCTREDRRILRLRDTLAVFAVGEVAKHAN
ncbi:hypothetical protein GCM10010293_41160 [Streptomyces griseoflavus]|nr:hypothetical protein GCM10010293_41160 [Streptomyces griseoflavus]